MINPPRVFISYSHDSYEHAEQVLSLAERLRSWGVDAMLDQYAPAPTEGWPMWMEREIQKADFVLLVCTDTYLKRAEGREIPGKGRGVRWESVLIYNLLYETDTTVKKFIPIFLASMPHIPLRLRGQTHYLVSTEEGFEGLYRHLTNQPQRELKALGELKTLPPIPSRRNLLIEDSINLSGRDANVTTDEGFCIAVLPFKSSGASANLVALAEGLTAGLITGLSRFSYLRIIVRGSTLRHANAGIDLRVAGKELSARYVMEGTLRQEGSILQLEVQLVDTVTGTNLWAENYRPPFRPESHFDLHDYLVPRIVSTVADARGVLAQTMGEWLRNRPPEELTPYEAVLRSFAYVNRLNGEEHALARAALELAVAKAPKAPGQSDAWAWLAVMYREEYVHGFNARPEPLDRAHAAALRAIEFGPSNHWAHVALASVLYYRREIEAFRNAAEYAIDLNPMDGTSMAYLASLLAVSGEWERACALVKTAQNMNPNFPGWYWIPAMGKAYLEGDYRGALKLALKINMPGFWTSQFLLAAIYGQLGKLKEAQKAVQDLLTLKPEFSRDARKEFAKRYEKDFLERLIDGLCKAGMEIADGV
jgi:TolB-like protein